MNSKLFKLCLSAILALSFNACGGDSNDDDNGGGGNNNKVECKSGDVICSPDGTSTLVCNAAGNGYDKKDDCANGCEDNACINGGGGSETPVCTANAKVCKNNQIMTCKADGSGYLNNPEDCEFGCDDGAAACNAKKCTVNQTKCSADGKSVETCNADGGWDSSACTDGCEAGHCIKCTENETKCNADNSAALTCQANGNWSSSACGTGSICSEGSCLDIPSYDACSAADLEDCLSRIDAAGYDRSDGVCLMENGEPGCYLGKCNAPNSKKIECSDNYDSMAVYVCSPIGNDGSGVWELVDLASDGECEFGCKEDLSACAEPLVPDQGADCSAASRADRCDGDILSYCHPYGVVAAVKCAEGKSCIELNNNGSVYADCYDPNDTCTEDVVSCEVESSIFGDYAYVIEKDCLSSVADSNKKYLALANEEECVSGACAADGESCEPALVDDLYEDCTPESRASRCDGAVYSFCNWDDDYEEGYVAAADCVEYDYDLCTTVAGSAMCYESCTTENQVDNFCYFDDDYEGYVIGTSTCIKDDAGTNLVAKKVLTKLCASGCNDTKDGCAYENEGAACDSSMGESCVGNTAVYCGTSGKIGAENCPGLYGDGMICYINDDDESWCAESCDGVTAGSVVTVCEEVDYYGLFTIAYQQSKKCVATKDGKQVYESVEGSMAYCDDQGCNAGGSACIAVDDD